MATIAGGKARPPIEGELRKPSDLQTHKDSFTQCPGVAGGFIFHPKPWSGNVGLKADPVMGVYNGKLFTNVEVTPDHCDDGVLEPSAAPPHSKSARFQVWTVRMVMVLPTEILIDSLFITGADIFSVYPWMSP